MRYICASIVATLVLAGTSFAATINVLGDHATIQGAINASSDGDVIQIATKTALDRPRIESLGSAHWSSRSGGTGNTYELFGSTPYISWTEADLVARQLGGYLAVVSSAAENQFLFDNFAWNPDLYRNGWWGPWLGGRQSTSQLDYSEPGGGWTWANGETWAYTNWQPGEPSNGNGGVESALSYIAFQEIPAGYWNDWAAHDEWPADTPWTFIVEYDSPEVTGACCKDDACATLTPLQCADIEGEYAGDYTTCDNIECQAACLGDADSNGEVNIDDILLVIARFGVPCP